MMASKMALRCSLVIASVLTLPLTSLAQVKVLISGGFSAPFEQLRPQFEKTTGIMVTTIKGQSQGTGPLVIGTQLRNGVAADVVIMSREGLDDIIKEGRIQGGTDVNLAQTPLGVSVRAGAPKPDIRTVEAFKKTLLQAKSITFPSSTTGIYMATKLFPKLGIADKLSGKITNTGVTAVANGKAEIAIQPVSELLPAAGVAFVGTIPAEIQYVSVFSAAIVAGSKQPDAAKRLISFLTSDNAKGALRKSGMDPLASRH